MKIKVWFSIAINVGKLYCSVRKRGMVYLIFALVFFAIPALAQLPCATPLSGVVVATQSTTVCTTVVTNITGSSLQAGYTYQWQIDNGVGVYSDLTNGSNYSNVTTPTLRIASPSSGINNYKLVVSNGSCFTLSGVATVTGVSPPTMVTQPATMRTCLGSDASTNVVALAGAGTLTYQWSKNGVQIPSATSSTLTLISPPVSEHLKNYTVAVGQSIGNCPILTSAIVNLFIYAPITLSTQPAITVCESTRADITVVASSVTNALIPFYQWKKNGVNIPGATGATYTIPTANSTHAGSYTVEVTGRDFMGNNYCSPSSVTSSPSILTILEKPEIIIGGGPSSQNVCAGDDVTFAVNAGVTETPTYQWRKNGINIATATNSTYTITGVAAAHAGNYTVVVGGACTPNVTSVAAVLTILSVPSIITQPESLTMCEGGTAAFRVVASGSGFSYQWKKNGINIPTANSDTYTIIGATSAHAGDYTVVVSSGTCSPPATSLTAELRINETPEITDHPDSQILCPGDNVTFTVIAGATESPNYQWRKDGSNISGVEATRSSYSLTGVTAADVGSYTVVVGGTCTPSITSDAATLTIRSYPSITTHPETSQVLCEGSPASFSIIASGQILSYQWQKDGVSIPGARSSTFTIPVTTSTDAGSYTALVTGLCTPSVVSLASLLSINEIPEILSGPESQTLCQGQDAFFTVDVGQTAGATYQWRKNNVNIPGARSNTYSITRLQAADAGSYSVVVSGTCTPSIVSTNAVLSIHNSPFINMQPIAHQQICEGSLVSFGVEATGTAITYQWMRDGVSMPGQISNTLVIPTTVMDNAGIYAVVVKGQCTPYVTSNPSTLTILPLPQVSAGEDKEGVIREAILLDGYGVSSLSLEYSWSPVEGISNPTIPQPLASPAVSTNYTLTVKDENGCVASDEVLVRLITPLHIPNTFSPNSDGINDSWRIDNVEFFPGATVEVFSRYGERVFFSKNSTEWNGTYNGNPLPWGTYYYVINLNDGRKAFNGWVVIVK